AEISELFFRSVHEAYVAEILVGDEQQTRAAVEVHDVAREAVAAFHLARALEVGPRRLAHPLNVRDRYAGRHAAIHLHRDVARAAFDLRLESLARQLLGG